MAYQAGIIGEGRGGGEGARKSERKRGDCEEGMPAIKTPFDRFLRFLADAKFWLVNFDNKSLED